MREEVTNDWKVARVLVKLKKPHSSADVAGALGLTPFQITARLKGMELRGFAKRINGLWTHTEGGVELAAGPEPVVSASSPRSAPTRKLGVVGERPSDKDAIEVDTRGWKIEYIRLGDIWNPKSTQRLVGIPVFVDLKGKKWVQAPEFEKAVLIRRFTTGLRPVRMIPLSTSYAGKILSNQIRAKEQAEERAAR